MDTIVSAEYKGDWGIREHHDLTRELKQIWNIKVRIDLIIVGIFGTFKNEIGWFENLRYDWDAIGYCVTDVNEDTEKGAQSSETITSHLVWRYKCVVNNNSNNIEKSVGILRRVCATYLQCNHQLLPVRALKEW